MLRRVAKSTGASLKGFRGAQILLAHAPRHGTGRLIFSMEMKQGIGLKLTFPKSTWTSIRNASC